MIAGGHERVGKPMEHSSIVMVDAIGFSMHKLRCSDDFSTKSLADRLMTETDTKNRKLGVQLLNEIQTNTGLIGGAWTRGQNDPIWPHGPNLRNAQRIVSPSLNIEVRVDFP
jgi:hypothetical protein